MIAVRWCRRGCVAFGQHLDDCPGDCRGCAPVPVESGDWCMRCRGRVVKAAAGAEPLAVWMRQHVVPGSFRPRDGEVLREAPMPLVAEAVDDVDALAALLFGLVARLVQSTDLTGPDLTRAGLTLRAPAPHLGWRVTGVKGDDVHTLGTLADWLIVHVDALSAMDWSGEAFRLVEMAGALRARYPESDRAKRLPLPCPKCDKLLLRMLPPRGRPTVKRGVADGKHLPGCHEVTTEVLQDGRVRVHDRPWVRPNPTCPGCLPTQRTVYAHDHRVVCANDECDAVLTEADYYWQASVALGERLALKRPKKKKAKA